jgi:hypothetical protein
LNGSQTFTAIPNTYYFVDSLIIDGINNPAAATAGTYTFTNVNEAHTIRATFATNYVTPTLITPPTIVETPVQDNALSTLSLTGGLVQHNGVDVPGVFTWVTPTTLLTSPGNYPVKFSPTDTNSYFSFTFNLNINFNISYLIVAGTGTSTTNANIPYYGTWMDAPQNNYILYPDSMMTALTGKTLTSMTFYTTTPATAVYNSAVTIKLGPTSLLEIPATGAVAFTPTTVFTGTISIVANQVVITFTTPYLYTGGNLIFEFNSVAANYIGATFTGVTRTNTSRRTYNTSTSRYSFIPKTKFQVAP